MKAPKELPTLPGIGGDGNMYHQFDTPSIFWNSKYFEGLKVKKIVLDDEDKNMSTSIKIVPKAVSKAPVITQQPWDPILGDSVHAYAWRSLSKEEMVGIINDQKIRSSKRPASQIAESPPVPKRISAPKVSVAKTPTTSSKTGADPPSPKETSTAKSAAIIAPVVPTVGTDLGIPLPEMTGPPGPQQSPPIECRGNAGIREASQVRANKTLKGSTLRTPHVPIALGKGTPPVPLVEAVGTYPTTHGMDRAIVSQHQAQSATSKGSTPDRSRSRDPPRETIPVVPIPQPQAVMNVPDYLLPIMATAGVGHLKLDRSGTPSVGVAVPPRVAQASAHNIAEFFESFSQAQDREAKVKAIQQFTAELLNDPQESASPAST